MAMTRGWGQYDVAAVTWEREIRHTRHFVFKGHVGVWVSLFRWFVLVEFFSLPLCLSTCLFDSWCRVSFAVELLLKQACMQISHVCSVPCDVSVRRCRWALCDIFCLSLWSFPGVKLSLAAGFLGYVMNFVLCFSCFNDALLVCLLSLPARSVGVGIRDHRVMTFLHLIFLSHPEFVSRGVIFCVSV